jgi:hypothetical protein
MPRNGYLVDIETEKSKLKLCEKQLIGETMAVLVKSQANLGRPDSPMVKEDDAVYVVYKPTKTAVLCSTDAGTIRNANSKIRLISITSLVKQLFEFSCAYTQLVFSLNDCAIVYSTSEFDDIVNKYKQITQNSKLFTYSSYRRNVATLLNTSERLTKSNGKSKAANKEEARAALLQKLFFIYKVADVCKYQYDRLSKSQKMSAEDYHTTFATLDYNNDEFYMNNMSEQVITGDCVPEHVIESINADATRVARQQRKLEEVLGKVTQADKEKSKCETANAVAKVLEKLIVGIITEETK